MKSAYWIRKTHLLRRDEYLCSVCRAVSAKTEKVCPNCGAKLNQVKKDLNWIEGAEILSALDEK